MWSNNYGSRRKWIYYYLIQGVYQESFLQNYNVIVNGCMYKRTCISSFVGDKAELDKCTNRAVSLETLSAGTIIEEKI